MDTAIGGLEAEACRRVGRKRQVDVAIKRAERKGFIGGESGHPDGYPSLNGVCDNGPGAIANNDGCVDAVEFEVAGDPIDIYAGSVGAVQDEGCGGWDQNRYFTGIRVARAKGNDAVLRLRGDSGSSTGHVELIQGMGADFDAAVQDAEFDGCGLIRIGDVDPNRWDRVIRVREERECGDTGNGTEENPWKKEVVGFHG